jgi:hypothetical protein
LCVCVYGPHFHNNSLKTTTVNMISMWASFVGAWDVVWNS